MEKHTKGPWKAWKTGTGCLFVGTPNQKITIAEVYPLEDGVNNTEKRIEAEANAHLIAMVPELLLVCKSLLANEASMPIEDLYFDFRAIEAIITKAEGRG